MTDQCASCGLAAIAGQWPGDETDDEIEEALDGLRPECAAGPWQPASTAPKGEKILVKVELDDKINVVVTRKYDGSWQFFPEDEQYSMTLNGKIIAWARIRTEGSG